MENADLSGGRSLTGGEQIIRNSFGFWSLSVDAVFIKPKHRPLWQAFMAKVDGRAGVVRVPLCSPNYQFFPTLTGNPNTPLPHSDQTLFSDGTGYRSSWFDARVDFAARRGTRVLAVNDVPAPLTWYPGLWITVQDRLYRLQSVEQQADLSWLLTVQGTLTTDVPLNARVEVDRPTGLFRFSDPDQGRVPATPQKLLTLSLDMEEAHIAQAA